VRVFTPFGGRVTKILAELGQTVSPGEPLVTIASADYGEAQAYARKAASDFILSERSLNRVRELFEHGAASQKDLQSAEADFQGLKVRISGSKIADRYFRDVGSIPQIMAFSEVYQALQTGVVDGCENTPSNYLTQKFYEVQKDITVSYHAHLQYAVIVNSKFWNGLPPDIRKALDKAMDEATDYTNSIAVKENEDALAEIKKSGKTTLHYLTDDQRKAWQQAMQPTYAWAKGRVGQEVLDLLAKELDIKMN